MTSSLIITPSENVIIRESTRFTKRRRFAAFHEKKKKTDSSSRPPVSPRRLTPRAS